MVQTPQSPPAGSLIENLASLVSRDCDLARDPPTRVAATILSGVGSCIGDDGARDGTKAAALMIVSVVRGGASNVGIGGCRAGNDGSAAHRRLSFSGEMKGPSIVALIGRRYGKSHGRTGLTRVQSSMYLAAGRQINLTAP